MGLVRREKAREFCIAEVQRSIRQVIQVLAQLQTICTVESTQI